MSDHVYQYCERGQNPEFWAEPLNAVTNASFLVAAGAALVMARRRPAEERDADLYLLIALVAFIGVGSFLFHTFANRWSELADVIPIGLFMLAYLGYALVRFLSVPPAWATMLMIGFAGLTALALSLKCGGGTIGFPTGETGAAAASCLNGSLGYVPALLAMAIVGFVLAERKRKAGRWILYAAAVFAVSLTFRTLDESMCAVTEIGSVHIGLHFLWHILNGVVLFFLLRAVLEDRAASRMHIIAPLLAKTSEPPSNVGMFRDP